MAADPAERTKLLAELDWLLRSVRAAGREQLDADETLRYTELMNAVRAIDGDHRDDPVSDQSERMTLLAEAQWLLHAAQAAGRQTLDPGETDRYNQLVAQLRAIDGAH